MDRYSDDFVTQLTLQERVNLVNNLLIGSSLKKVINHFAFSKGRLKELLKPYEYNMDTKKFELQLSSDSELLEDIKFNDDELQEDSVVELLIDVKKILQKSYKQQKMSNEIMLQISDDLTTHKMNLAIEESELKVFRARANDELKIRSFKIYDSINERLKLATQNSDFNQQQLFNSLLDKALKDIGW